VLQKQQPDRMQEVHGQALTRPDRMQKVHGQALQQQQPDRSGAPQKEQ
jgi:hypothetical protein